MTAPIQPVRITNIVSVTVGSVNGTQVYGVSEVTYVVDVSDGLKPLVADGAFLPSASDQIGQEKWPVTTNIIFENDDDTIAGALFIGAAAADLVITKRVDGGNSSQVVTISNHQFTRTTVAANRQGIQKPAVAGVAYSSDGVTIPVSST